MYLEVRTRDHHEPRAGALEVVQSEPTLWVRLPSEPMTVGRLTKPAEQHLQISEPTLSRLHFSIAPGEGGFVLTDLGSAGGTWVNEEQVRTAILRDGDRIALGGRSSGAVAVFRASAPRVSALTDIGRRWLLLWNGADRPAFDALHTEGFVDRASSGRPMDREGFWSGLVALREALPDLEVRCDDAIVAADRDVVTVRWSGEGTHRAPYLGQAPTGRRVKLRGIEVISLDGGRVRERWGEWDGLDLLAQLGNTGAGPAVD